MSNHITIDMALVTVIIDILQNYTWLIFGTHEITVLYTGRYMCHSKATKAF